MRFTTPSSSPLSDPLLGVLPPRDQCEYQCFDPEESMTLANTKGDLDISIAGSEDDDCQRSWCDLFIVWILLPGLLVLQFGCALGNHTPDGDFGWNEIAYSVFTFVVTMYLFELSVHETLEFQPSAPLHHHSLILVPELAMDITLILLLFDRANAAYIFFQSSVLAMSLFVMISSMYTLFVVGCCEARQDSLSDASDEEQDHPDRREDYIPAQIV
jgi:hypothetical protein